MGNGASIPASPTSNTSELSASSTAPTSSCSRASAGRAGSPLAMRLIDSPRSQPSRRKRSTPGTAPTFIHGRFRKAKSMLQKTEYTAKAVTLQSLAIERKGARARARLAAKWLVESIEVKRTVAMAAVIFGVSQPYINEALGGRLKDARTRNGNGHNGNGHSNGLRRSPRHQAAAVHSEHRGCLEPPH